MDEGHILRSRNVNLMSGRLGRKNGKALEQCSIKVDNRRNVMETLNRQQRILKVLRGLDDKDKRIEFLLICREKRL